MHTASVGQDQSITRGRYVGPRLQVDAFYPLPEPFTGRSSFLYLFGTANLAIAKPRERTPLAPLPFFPSRALETRIGVGVGIDLIRALKGWLGQ